MKNLIAVLLFGAVCAAFAWSTQPGKPPTVAPSPANSYTQADIDEREERIKILQGRTQSLTEERDAALRERDQANATIRSMAEDSKRLVAATGKAMANCAGSVPATQQRAYTPRRRLFGRH